MKLRRSQTDVVETLVGDRAERFLFGAYWSTAEVVGQPTAGKMLSKFLSAQGIPSEKRRAILEALINRSSVPQPIAIKLHGESTYEFDPVGPNLVRNRNWAAIRRGLIADGASPEAADRIIQSLIHGPPLDYS